MDGFTLVDGIVALVILVSALLAYARGVVREAMAILGWIAAAVIAFVFAESARPLMAEIPVVGDFLADSCELSVIAAFAAVFTVALVIVSLFTPLLSSLVQKSALSGLDQGFGFLFGVARGLILVALAFFLYQTMITAQDIAMINDSRSAAVLAQVTESVAERDPEAALGWITQQYETLVGACNAP
jgi:membrane protein required for colicin V production